MGWISAEGVAAVVQGAVRIPFNILLEFKNNQIPLFSGEASGSVCGLGGVGGERGPWYVMQCHRMKGQGRIGYGKVL